MQALKQAALSLGTLALAGAVFLLLREKTTQIAIGLGVAALVIPVLWLIVSSMRPAMPERRCPKCWAESLRLLKPGEKIGVRCPKCGFQDAEMYVAYLIDVDDALEEEEKREAAAA